jgi:hypothetical protein
VQHPGAHGLGEPRQFRVVADVLVHDPHQPDRGGREQQRPDGGVDGPVGEVEQPVPLGVGDEPGVQPRLGGGVFQW